MKKLVVAVGKGNSPWGKARSDADGTASCTAYPRAELEKICGKHNHISLIVSILQPGFIPQTTCAAHNDPNLSVAVALATGATETSFFAAAAAEVIKKDQASKADPSH